jgi:hypothetical protein
MDFQLALLPPESPSVAAIEKYVHLFYAKSIYEIHSNIFILVQGGTYTNLPYS